MDLLFSNYRRQVLGLLLLRPDDSLYVRQIARLTGVPAGSLHRELVSLESVGLLLREPFGNHVRYRANRTHPIYGELAEIFRKTSGLGGAGSRLARAHRGPDFRGLRVRLHRTRRSGLR